MFAAQPRLGAVGGFVRDIGPDGELLRDTEPGTFDWFLRAGYRGDVPPEGIPTFFFPERASVASGRRWHRSGATEERFR